MSIFAMGDTHLSLGTDKPMDIFGGWDDYVNRIEKNWRSAVGGDDTVVLCGDISWAMRLENLGDDMTFLHNLPGRKLILKGNHDYWWATRKKMDAWLSEKGFHTVGILFNNAYSGGGDISICGTRGWSYDCPESERAILLREVGRLKMSLDAARKEYPAARPVVFLHYPPVYANYRCDEIMDVLHEYGVSECYYGHLHGAAGRSAVQGDCEGIKMRLVSGDHLDFMPLRVS